MGTAKEYLKENGYKEDMIFTFDSVAFLMGEYDKKQSICPKCGGIKVCEWCEPFNTPIPKGGLKL